MEYTARVEGIPQWRDALRGTLVSLDRATQRATGDGALLVERETKLILRLTSHPAGTPTPSPPGAPPALVTGFLARSVETRAARPTGAYRWHAESGPTAVYARIQELGGRTPRGTLPPRPALRPVYERVRSPIRNQYERRWREVLSR